MSIYGKLRVKVTKKTIIDRVVLPQQDLINQTRLAEILGISKQAVSYYMNTGMWPLDYIDKLKNINLRDVVGSTRRQSNGKEDKGLGKAGKKAV